MLGKFVPQAVLSKVTDERKKKFNDHKKMVGMSDKKHYAFFVFFCVVRSIKTVKLG